MIPVTCSRFFLVILIGLLILSACIMQSPQPNGSPTLIPEATDIVPSLNTVEWTGLGSLSYDPTLAQSVEIANVEAIPPDPARMSKEWRPAYAQFRFTGYDNQRVFQLPYPIADAQVMIFHTVDFAPYTEGSSLDFPRQLQALNDLLSGGLETAGCTRPHRDQSSWLPFLPWVYGAQTFCARPQMIEFHGGRGIRYITYYTQDVSPVLDSLVFYTFQGLTNDGEYYISAVFPIQTGVFPGESSVSLPGEDLFFVLSGQMQQLNSQPEDAFQPSLNLLDAVIESIYIP